MIRVHGLDASVQFRVEGIGIMAYSEGFCV